MGRILIRLLFVALFVLTGCATERYGRLQSVTPLEAESYDCKAIEVEMDKANGFIKQVNDEHADISGKDHLGFLGDLGIGNRIEYHDAIESATKRIEQLNALDTSKRCSSERGMSESE